MITLGINSVYHESSAAIVKNGKILAAVEEERFSRKKHAKPAQPNTADQLPVAAIAFCLQQAGIDSEQLDAIAISFNPELRRQQFQLDPISIDGGWGSKRGEDTFSQGLANIPEQIGKCLGENAPEKLYWLPHHLCHSASAFFPSPYREAAILTIDGIAESASTQLAMGDGNIIRPLKELDYPHSMGFLWEKFAEFLGFSEYDACKVMSMASYGRATFMNEMRHIAQLTEQDFAINHETVQFRVPDYSRLEHHLGKRRLPNEPLEQRHFDIACSLQAFTTGALLTLIQDLYQRCPSQNLCLAGGVALNCAGNWTIQEKSPFPNLYIPAAPHDAGTAIGAALQLEASSNGNRAAGQLNPYLGPDYGEGAIRNTIVGFGLTAQKVEDPAQMVAQLIATGNIVGERASDGIDINL